MNEMKLQRILVVIPISVMELPSYANELVVPVLFESSESLKNEIISVLEDRKNRLLEIEAIKPNDEFFDKFQDIDFENLNDETQKLVNQFNAYYEPHYKLVTEERFADFNGVKIDMSVFLDEHTFEITIPEVLTQSEWFDSRIDSFKTSPE